MESLPRIDFVELHDLDRTPAVLRTLHTESIAFSRIGVGRSRTIDSNSAKPNAPTSAGTSWIPPAKSRLPNENRS